MVVNAEGVREWSSTSKAFASLSPGLFQPWVSKYCQRQRRRCWLGVVCERFQRCEDLFLARHPGLFQPWVSKYCQRQRGRCWLGVVCERFQRCEDLFCSTQGCSNPGLKFAERFQRSRETCFSVQAKLAFSVQGKLAFSVQAKLSLSVQGKLSLSVQGKLSGASNETCGSRDVNFTAVRGFVKRAVNNRQGERHGDVSGLLHLLLGREGGQDLVGDRQVEHRVSLCRISTGGHRLERHRSRSRPARQQLDRSFRSQWTTCPARRPELFLPRCLEQSRRTRRSQRCVCRINAMGLRCCGRGER